MPRTEPLEHAAPSVGSYVNTHSIDHFSPKTCVDVEGLSEISSGKLNRVEGGSELSGVQCAFYEMEKRRLQRALGGRERAVSHGRRANKVLLVFVVFQFVITQFSMMELTYIHNSQEKFRRLLDSSVMPIILSIVTFLIFLYTIGDCYLYPEHVTAKLGLSVVYACALWFSFFYSLRSAYNTSVFALGRDEWAVVSVFLSLEGCVLLGHVVLHWLYPRVLDFMFRHKLKVVISWWFGADLLHPSTFDNGEEDYETARFTVNYRQFGWLLPLRRQAQYRGSVDCQGRPHGWGQWTDNSYHGESLVGFWHQGRPVGPFRSREKGTGATFSSTHIGYFSSRAEGISNVFCCPRRAEGAGGFRYGTVGVEASTGGGFFEHLPRLCDHRPTSSLQGAIDSLINTKPDRSSSALEGSLTGVDFRVVSEEELDRLRAGPNPLITGSLKYHVTSGRVYVRQEEVGPIPRALSSSTREALIFIHGYNCSLEFGLCKLGQLYALGR
jgi:hypothetical protein